jgi:hypothetical protein
MSRQPSGGTPWALVVGTSSNWLVLHRFVLATRVRERLRNLLDVASAVCPLRQRVSPRSAFSRTMTCSAAARPRASSSGTALKSQSR